MTGTHQIPIILSIISPSQVTKVSRHVCVGDRFNAHDVLVGLGEKSLGVSFSSCVDGLVKGPKNNLPQVEPTCISLPGFCQFVNNFIWKRCAALKFSPY